VKQGDTIKVGDVIGTSGQTGNVATPQVHFEIRKGSTPVDPMRLLPGA
jgi:murein DD-endopeptidase MepM/ murein hydrolase activator NlpD